MWLVFYDLHSTFSSECLQVKSLDAQHQGFFYALARKQAFWREAYKKDQKRLRRFKALILFSSPNQVHQSLRSKVGNPASVQLRGLVPLVWQISEFNQDFGKDLNLRPTTSD